MPRILVVTPNYPSYESSTDGIFIHRQIVNLIRQGCSCDVLLLRSAPPRFPRWLIRRSWLRHYWRRLGWQGKVDGVRIHVVYYQRKWEPNEDVVPAMGAALVDYVTKRPSLQDPDLVYAHFLWPAGAASLRLREQFGWPLAAIARGSEMHEWQLSKPHCRSYVQQVLSEADQALANCDYLRRLAYELVAMPRKPVEVIYNGCDSEFFRPADDRNQVRKTIGISPSNRLALFCGTIEERKGVRELAQAWQQFAPSHPDWKLIAIGSISDPGLAQVLERSHPGSVTLTGRLNAGGVLKHLQAADAYLQPSQLEGLPNATMEAMAVGLPVVTTDSCGQRELIRPGENGWLIGVGNVSQLVQKLTELAADPEHEIRIGQAARQTIVSEFDPQYQARRLKELLWSLGRHEGSIPSPRICTAK